MGFLSLDPDEARLRMELKELKRDLAQLEGNLREYQQALYPQQKELERCLQQESTLTDNMFKTPYGVKEFEEQMPKLRMSLLEARAHVRFQNERIESVQKMIARKQEQIRHVEIQLQAFA
jgi:chromosome segregation ATPase